MDIGKIVKIGDRQPEPVFIPQKVEPSKKEPQKTPAKVPEKVE